MFGFILLFLCWKKQHKLGELSLIDLVLGFGGHLLRTLCFGFLFECFRLCISILFLYVAVSALPVNSISQMLIIPALVFLLVFIFYPLHAFCCSVIEVLCVLLGLLFFTLSLTSNLFILWSCTEVVSILPARLLHCLNGNIHRYKLVSTLSIPGPSLI